MKSIPVADLFQEYRVHLAVLAVALLSYGLIEVEQKKKLVMPSATNSPDVMSKGYYKQVMNEDGIPKNELNASTMKHYSQDNSSFFEQPVMKLFKPTQAPWVLRSETAIMAGDGDHLQMNGKSFISRDASPNNSALSIDTANLKVQLSINYAETQAFTVIRSAPQMTQGTGMEATFVSPIHLKLLSTVHGVYELKK